MTPEHTKYLYDTYPALYRQHALPMSETAMCWGLDIADGWFDIIDELSRKIIALDKQSGTTTEAVQVKEKFGTLRFYVDFGTDEVFEAIEEAERKSAVTCELCGKPGMLRRGGWLKVKCDECAGDEPRKEKP